MIFYIWVLFAIGMAVGGIGQGRNKPPPPTKKPKNKTKITTQT